MEELKKDEVKVTPDDTAQVVKQPDSNEEDTSKTIIELEADKAILEEKLSKEILEKENYRQGMLSAKEKLKEGKGEQREEEKPEEKAKEEITEVKTEVKEPEVKNAGYNPEKEAIAQFSKKHPNVDMSNVLKQYRGGKQDTVVGILDALEDANDYYEYKSGKPSNVSQLAGQGSGISETKNTVIPKVTTEDIKIADKMFKGDIQRYLKYKNKAE